MSVSPDHLGDTLRKFYATFGRPNEGPPPNLNVTTLMGNVELSDELATLREALDDQALCRQFKECRDLLDQLANRLGSNELLQELARFSVPERDFEQLANGVFWFALATSLDRRDGGGGPVPPYAEMLDFPVPVKIRMTVQGSLVMRLYISLVFMREGPLSRLINEAAKARLPCAGAVRKLLNSDYVRRIRNGLSHGSFSTAIAGLVFRDDKGAVVATPEFLNWLCTWLTLIQLQALSASSMPTHTRPVGGSVKT